MPSVSAAQPLAVDWRDKIKGSRKTSQSSASASTYPSPAAAQPSSTTHASSPDVAASVTADGKPDLDLLSKGLPKGWRAMWDKNTGDIYYGNLKTRVRTSSSFAQQNMTGLCSGLACYNVKWFAVTCSFALWTHAKKHGLRLASAVPGYMHQSAPNRPAWDLLKTGLLWWHD